MLHLCSAAISVCNFMPAFGLPTSGLLSSVVVVVPIVGLMPIVLPPLLLIQLLLFNESHKSVSFWPVLVLLSVFFGVVGWCGVLLECLFAATAIGMTSAQPLFAMMLLF